MLQVSSKFDKDVIDIQEVMFNVNVLKSRLSFKEISKIYREIIYDIVGIDSKIYQTRSKQNIEQLNIMQQKLSGFIDIFTQMYINKRVFDDNYLKDKFRW